MTVLRVDVWNIRPGRRADFDAFMRRVAPRVKAHGARNVRFMQLLVGGAFTGTLYSEIEADDMEASAAIDRAVREDAETWQLILSQFAGDGTTTGGPTVYAEQLADLGRRTTSYPGCIESIYNYKVDFAREDEFLANVRESAPFADEHDARLRVFRTMTGSNTGELFTVLEHRDLAAYGRFMDAVWQQPAFRELVRQRVQLGTLADGSLHVDLPL
jgi:hypothetical protein